MPDLQPAVLARIRRQVADGGRIPDGPELGMLVREAGGVLGREDLAGLPARVRDELLGAGPLQPLLDEPGVSDVLVNGPEEVWVDRGAGLERSAVRVPDVRALAVRLAAAGGQRLDDAAPVVDACLPDGTRLHAVLPPVGADGTLISLRVLRRTAFRLDELVAVGSVAPQVADVLRCLVVGRANLLVSGATGTGKTTLLATLLSVVDPGERIVCIEEARELAPTHPHVVHLVTRRPNVEGAGEVDLVALVRHALRMRPDRLVLGECRGPEVREVLTALNTGHQGGCATVHANALADVPARLAALGALAGMSPQAVAAQAVSALDAVVHLRRDGGRRYVAQVGTVVDGTAGVSFGGLTDGALGDAACTPRRGPGDGRWWVEPVLEVAASGAVTVTSAWAGFARRWRIDGAG